MRDLTDEEIWANDVEAVRDVLDGYDDDGKLSILAFSAAEILSEYVPGDDRTQMIDAFADDVEEGVEFLDAADDESEPSVTANLGEILDTVADKAFFQTALSKTGHLDNRDAYRILVNEKFGLNLPLYADETEDVICSGCGCTIHD